MFRMLFWKDWRQLRALRYSAAGLFAVLPAVLLGAVEASRRGWMPFGRGSGYSVSDVIGDAVPIVMSVAWGVLAALLGAQAFTGERAAGTEAFLLSRPVRRGTIALARLAATLASSAWIVVASVLIWLVWFAATGTGGEVVAILSRMLPAGAALIGLGVFGAIVAAAFLDAPLAVAMAGVVVGAVTPALALFVANLFPYAWPGRLPGGAILAAFLLSGFTIASVRALCGGEPAGRGRLRRAAVGVGVTLACATLAFAVSAPLSVRLNTHWYRHDAALAPAPRGDLVLLEGDDYPSAELVDVRTGRRTHLFPPAIVSSSWSTDGEYLALIQYRGQFGLASYEPRLLIVEARSGATIRAFSGDELGFDFTDWPSAEWIASGVVVRSDLRLNRRVAFIDRAAWQLHVIDLGEAALGVECRRAHTCYAVFDEGQSRELRDRYAPRALRVHALDPIGGSLSAPLVRYTGTPFELAGRLSPRGEYWVEGELGRAPGDPGKFRVVSVPSGEQVLAFHALEIAPDEYVAGIRGTRFFTWLSDDRLAYVDDAAGASRVLLWHPGGAIIEIDHAEGAGGWALRPSPDRRRLMLDRFGGPHMLDMHGGLTGDAHSRWRRVYDIDTDARTDLDPSWLNTWVEWAGATTLARRTDDGFEFYQLPG